MRRVEGSDGHSRWNQEDGSRSANADRHDGSSSASGIHFHHDASGSNEPHQIADGAGCKIGSPDELAKSGPLGLSLEKTPAFIDLIVRLSRKGRSRHGDSIHQGGQLRIDGEEKQKKVKLENNIDHVKKPKASSCAGKVLKIGSWERSTQDAGDLVFKCYFAKKKFVWEILENGLKKKIEFPWSTITAIRASFSDERGSFLDVELEEPPHFFQELNPQPRKHTLWQGTTDFTGGQASVHRWHHMEFNDRSFEKDYEELLRYDTRFFTMSKKPFPCSSSAIFEKLHNECRNLPCFSNVHGSTLPNPFSQQAGNVFPSQVSDFINPLPLNALSQDRIPLGSLNSSMGIAYSAPLPAQPIGLESFNSSMSIAYPDPLQSMQGIGFTGGNSQIPVSALGGACPEASGVSYGRNANYVLPDMGHGMPYLMNQSPALPVFPPFGNNGMTPLWNEGMVDQSSLNFGMEPQFTGIPRVNCANQETTFISRELFEETFGPCADVSDQQYLQVTENYLIDQTASSLEGHQPNDLQVIASMCSFGSELGAEDEADFQPGNFDGLNGGNNQDEANTFCQQTYPTQQQGGYDQDSFMR